MTEDFGPGILGGVVLIDPSTGQAYRAMDTSATPADWDTLVNKPAVIAAGTTQAAARTAIGAGTSSLGLGTTGTTAAAGNDSRLSDARTPIAHGHPVADITGLGTSAVKRASTLIDALDPPAPLVAAKFDGTSDDSAALQAMLDSIAGSSQGGTILCPAGKTSKCNLVVRGKGGVNLIGAGRSTVLMPFNQYGFLQKGPSQPSVYRTTHVGTGTQCPIGILYVAIDGDFSTKKCGWGNLAVWNYNQHFGTRGPIKGYTRPVDNRGGVHDGVADLIPNVGNVRTMKINRGVGVHVEYHAAREVGTGK